MFNLGISTNLAHYPPRQARIVHAAAPALLCGGPASSAVLRRQKTPWQNRCIPWVSKRGDIYLRTLLIHGARSVLRVAARHAHPTTTRRTAVQARRNPNLAAVALANKQARIVWALLAHDREYTPDYAVTSP